MIRILLCMVWVFVQAAQGFAQTTDSLPPANSDWSMAAELSCGERANVLFPTTFRYRDGSVEQWQVRMTEIKSLRLKLFDNKGCELFSVDIFANYMANDVNEAQLRQRIYETGWNGTHNGKVLPKGFYFYMAEAVGMDGKKCRQSGNVLLN